MDELKEETSTIQAASEQQTSSTCQEELATVKARYLYLNAEFDNFKKRVEKDRLTWMETAQDMVLLDLLAIQDDMDRALAEFESLAPELRLHLAGVELIGKNVGKILKKYDIEEIPLHRVFDPEKYDAIMQVTHSEVAPGEVVAIIQKGYTRKGRILRPAKVSVAQ
jgi:molecular chaperone GrpE